jgi:hypothetical protein
VEHAGKSSPELAERRRQRFAIGGSFVQERFVGLKAETRTAARIRLDRANDGLERRMSDVVYTSTVRLERVKGPLRIAYLPGEVGPVRFSVHGAIAEHYRVDPATVERHAATIDYVIAATAG